METSTYKFRGGVWIGFTSATWPWGHLEVGPDTLVVRDELSKKELILSKKDTIKIKTIKSVSNHWLRSKDRNQRRV